MLVQKMFRSNFEQKINWKLSRGLADVVGVGWVGWVENSRLILNSKLAKAGAGLRLALHG